MKNINESILDPIQTVRCDALFNPNDKSEQPVMLKTATDFILGLLQRFKEDTGLDFEYTEVFMVGSSLGFQYKDTSDIDVDARISLPREALKGKFHLIPKNIPLPGTAHPVNIFLMTTDDPEFDFENNCENAYDLLTNTWIKQGRLQNSDPIPYEHIAGMAEVFIDAMAVEIDRANRTIYEVNKYMNIDPSKSQITDKERKEAISGKIGELIKEKDSLRFIHALVFNFERAGFEWNSPFKLSIKYVADKKHFSANNLIYKYIDQFGYYDKIDETVKLIDKTINTAKESIKPVLEDTPETRNNAEAQAEIGAPAAEPQPKKEVQEESFDEKKEKINPSEVIPQKEQEALQSGEIVEESFTDSELAYILTENGFNADKNSIELLKSGQFIIGDYYDPVLEEDLKTRTEHFMNRKIYKASGKVNKGVTNTLGFLFAGLIGFLVSDLLSDEHNATKDEIEDELYDMVHSDPECMRIISSIRSEVNKPDPDKSKLKELKKEFAGEVKRCKKEYIEEQRRREHPELYKQKISLKEDE